MPLAFCPVLQPAAAAAWGMGSSAGVRSSGAWFWSLKPPGARAARCGAIQIFKRATPNRLSNWRTSSASIQEEIDPHAPQGGEALAQGSFCEAPRPGSYGWQIGP